MDKLIKTKTFWAGIGGLTAAAGAFFTGEMSLPQTIQVAVTALMGIFIRHGMVKSETK